VDKPDALQDLIGLVGFAHLAFPGLDALLLLAARSSPQTLVALWVPHPATQRLCRAANLGFNRADRRSLRGVN
jgi:hypothetical protein